MTQPAALANPNIRVLTQSGPRAELADGPAVLWTASGRNLTT
jgi:hypothetical protein